MRVTKEAPAGGGIDYVVDTTADPDDTFRFRVLGDAYPRVEIDPRGTIKVGAGNVGPTLLGGSAGYGTTPRPSYNVLDAGLLRTTDTGYLVGSTYLVNSFAFAVLVNLHAGEACDFIFPPGIFDTAGFTLANPGQRIIGAGGAAANQGDPGRGTKFVHRNAGTPCVMLRGTNGDRSFGLGAIGVKISNSSAALYGLVLEHLSHFQLEDVWVSAFRGDGGGLRAANAMDGALYDCCTDFCGSADGSNRSAVKLTATDYLGAAAEDACNEIRFFRHRYENISDRCLDYDSVGGLLVNKIDHYGCKFENSQQDTNGTNGSLDAAQSWMRLDHADQIQFIGGDITIQALNTLAPGTLPRMMDIINGSRVKMIGIGMFTGSLGAVKVFDTWIHAHGNVNNHLMLDAVQFNSANAGSFPDTVLTGDAATKPVLNQKCVGFDPFQGSGKVGTDWYTAAEWSALGQVA